MKRKNYRKNVTHHRVYETGDGVRRLYYEELEDYHFQFPKRRTNYRLERFVDGHMANRPTYGILSLAKVSETLLARARKTHNQPLILEATSFFAQVRRGMESVLRHNRVTSRLTVKRANTVRRLYLRLCKKGSDTIFLFNHLTSTTTV